MRGAGWSRVTHPFATVFPAEAGLTVRLACVRHAASVHPEPGSNSPFEKALIQENKKGLPESLTVCRHRASRGARFDSSSVPVSGSQGSAPARRPGGRGFLAPRPLPLLAKRRLNILPCHNGAVNDSKPSPQSRQTSKQAIQQLGGRRAHRHNL